MSNWAIAAIALGVTLAVTPLIIVVARRSGIIDRPGPLKPQAVAVPYLGGVAVFIGLIVGPAAGRPSVVIPLALALGLGVADDRFDLPAWVRLLGQIGIGTAIVLTCPVHLPGLVAVLTVIPVTVLVINGVNLIDGLDMLAAGVTAAGAVGFALVLHGPGRQIAVATAAALVGFLAYNRPPARVYLGDGGSYLLGAALTALLAESWGPGISVHIGIAALALVAVPVAEVAFAVVRRVRGHRSLLAGDRGHPYDRLVARGWPRPAASVAYIGMQALIAAAVVVVVHLGSEPGAVVVCGAAAILLLMAAMVTGALAPDEART
jgi:UDP-GlcNAc:undecaprenyl-phosphate/decaprenyl-phosphate GlcNAc-1-phosphate transferase